MPLDYEAARHLVTEHLHILDRKAEKPQGLAIQETGTLERPWGWIFFWNTRLFLETGDLEHAMMGNPPICVNRLDGAVTIIGGDGPLEAELRRYERRIGFRKWWRFW